MSSQVETDNQANTEANNVESASQNEGAEIDTQTAKSEMVTETVTTDSPEAKTATETVAEVETESEAVTEAQAETSTEKTSNEETVAETVVEPMADNVTETVVVEAEKEATEGISEKLATETVIDKETEEEENQPTESGVANNVAGDQIHETQEVSSTKNEETRQNNHKADIPKQHSMRHSSSRRASYNNTGRAYAGGYQNYGLTYLPYKSNFEPSEDAKRRADEFLQTLMKL